FASCLSARFPPPRSRATEGWSASCWFVVWKVAADPKRSARSVLISRRQQFVDPAITYERRIVQSRRGGSTVAVSRLHDCVVGVDGVPLGSRSRHLFIPTQEFASGVRLQLQ